MFLSPQPGELRGELFASFAWEFDSAVLDVPGRDSQPRALIFDGVAWTLKTRRPFPRWRPVDIGASLWTQHGIEGKAGFLSLDELRADVAKCIRLCGESLFFHLKSPIRWRMLVDIPEKCTQFDRRRPLANGTFYAAA